MSFIAYKSSAGSGKTFTLVKEYIRLCLTDPEKYRHILAITFTNKAASEMKERVISYLAKLSESPADKESKAIKYLLPELISETKLSEQEIAIRSKQVLDTILHNYSDFAIGTIDSFVHRVIKIFAHDLKIPLNFEVEMDVERMLSEAIDLMISKAGSDEQLTKILVEFTENKTDEEKSWHIENDIFNFAKQFLRDDSSLHLENIRKLSIKDFLEVRKKLQSLSEVFEKSIIKIAERANRLIRDNDIPLESFYYGNSGIGKYFEKLSRGIIEKGTPGARVAETLSKNTWYAGKCTDDVKKRIDTIKDTLEADCRKIIELLKKNYKNYTLYKLLLANIYPLAVLSEIEKVIDEIKKENNILPISEFNKEISKIVVNQPVPFIYERIGEKYQNYLIDEFQDTSALQWINLLPLIENSLGYDYFNLIVGDGKQAIYRWRGGDVEQFALLPGIPQGIADMFSKERAAAIQRNYQEKYLSSNFRSKAEIVDFNNKLFGHISELSSPYIRNIYSKCRQEYDINNTGGSVHISFIKDDAVAEEQGYANLTNTKIKGIIKQLLDSEYAYSDIAVLCRRRKETSAVARYLISEGIPVISDESLLVSSSEDVCFLLAFAELSVDKENRIAMFRILHYLMEKEQLDGRDLFTISSMIKKDDAEISFGNFCHYLHDNGFEISMPELETMAVFEFFKELTLLFGMRLNKNPHLQFFLDAVLEYGSSGKNSLASFIEWWEEEKVKRSVIIPEGTDAVRSMTIHKSKGLEFPVVIYPYAFNSRNSQNDFLWIHPEIKNIPELKSALLRKSSKMEETEYASVYETEVSKTSLDNLNILYVALTRAEQHLLILTKEASEDFSEPGNTPEYLASFLESCGLWDENKTEYSFGKLTEKKTDEDAKKKIPAVPLNDFKRKERSQTIHLKKRSSDFWDAENPGGNTEWGNTVHYVLSKISSSEDVNKIINEVKECGFVASEKIDELKNNVLSVITHPLLSEYFNKGIKILNESEIILSDGEILRPDRVILNENKAVVIDYKTGSKSEKHIRQVNDYAEALAQMGFSQIRKFLVYISENAVQEIS